MANSRKRLMVSIVRGKTGGWNLQTSDNEYLDYVSKEKILDFIEKRMKEW